MDSIDDVVAWLLEGDAPIRYQTWRDLLGEDRPDLATLIATEGDAALLLAARHQDGHWGRGFYQPKWTSSHYTLLELRNLELPHEHPAARETVQLILRETGSDGGGKMCIRDRLSRGRCPRPTSPRTTRWNSPLST